MPGFLLSNEHWQKRQAVGGFTLLEMLVVITIIAVMVALTAGVTGALNGSKGNTAAHQVAAAVDLARSKSLAGQGEVVLAFATAQVSLPGIAWRAMIICQEAEGSSSVVGTDRSAIRYDAITGWFYLPEGYVFSQAPPADPQAGVNVLTAGDSLITVRLPGGGSEEVALPCIGFQQLGEVVVPPQTQGLPILVALAEGEATSAGPTDFGGAIHRSEQCRWVAVQRLTGNSKVLP